MFNWQLSKLDMALRQLTGLQGKVDDAASKIVQGVMRLVDVELVEVPSARSTLPGRDFRWYDDVATALATEGFGAPTTVEPRSWADRRAASPRGGADQTSGACRAARCSGQIVRRLRVVPDMAARSASAHGGVPPCTGPLARRALHRSAVYRRPRGPRPRVHPERESAPGVVRVRTGRRRRVEPRVHVTHRSCGDRSSVVRPRATHRS